ncbi:MAG: PIN domain-containing protein [Terracidiphilus sp.]
MSRYLLDTNIISNPIKPAPSPSLIAWLEDQADEDLYTSSLNLAEIWDGILQLPPGKKRRELEKWFTGPRGPQAFFRDRLLAFDDAAALVWGRLMSDGVNAGRPRDPIDMIVAATAEANGCIIVTDNEKHFAGLKFMNPMRR